MRIFKTKWFAREASSHVISDNELYQAIQSALQGKVVDLGGGVYKKRLNKNRDRAIILTKAQLGIALGLHKAFWDIDYNSGERYRFGHRSEEHTSELQSQAETLFPYTTLFRSR